MLYFFSVEVKNETHPCFRHVFTGPCGRRAVLTCGRDSGCEQLTAESHACICRLDGREVGDDYSCSKGRHRHQSGAASQGAAEDPPCPRGRLILSPSALSGAADSGGLGRTEDPPGGNRTDFRKAPRRRYKTPPDTIIIESYPDAEERHSPSFPARRTEEPHLVTTRQNSGFGYNRLETASRVMGEEQASGTSKTNAFLSSAHQPQTSATMGVTAAYGIAVGVSAAVSVLLVLSAWLLRGKYKSWRRSRSSEGALRGLKRGHQFMQESPSGLESLLAPEVMITNLLYDDEVNKRAMRSNEVQESASRRPPPGGLQYLNPSQVILGEEIGEGFFGKVYKGAYFPESRTANHSGEPCDSPAPPRSASSSSAPSTSTSAASPVTVAVKQLKQHALSGYDNDGALFDADLLREANAVAQFSHENILKCIGLVKPSDFRGSLLMVLEYMDEGDLATWLRRSARAFFPNDGTRAVGANLRNQIETLEQMAIQIAAGMAYLAKEGFVHRDLACRNCLVSKNLVVKISDFGMARRMYNQNYYRAIKSKTLPVRWMSPESISYSLFTLASDIWAYGVVLWEIFSLGKQPYYGLNGEEVMKVVLKGKRLEIPELTPRKFFFLMERCWLLEANERITAYEIHRILLLPNAEAEKILENGENVRSSSGETERPVPGPSPPPSEANLTTNAGVVPGCDKTSVDGGRASESDDK